MKKNIPLLIFIIGCTVINAQDPHYEITGTITGAEGVIFTLHKRLRGKPLILMQLRLITAHSK